TLHMSTSRNTLPSMQATNPNATSKIGLALSGGGFRATLFHLGVVAAFRQLGRLKEVGVVSCVSGGSIIGAHLVLNWHRYISVDKRYLTRQRENSSQLLLLTFGARLYGDCHYRGTGDFSIVSISFSTRTLCSPL